MGVLELKIPLKKPTGKQKELFDIDTRYLIALIGRQFGKTTMGECRGAKRALDKKGEYFWISPIQKQARDVFREFVSYFRPVISKINSSYLECTLINGSLYQFTGADEPDSLRGKTGDGFTFDEHATIKPYVWHEIVKPMTAVRGAWVDFYGTPKGPNHFQQLWASAAGNPEWTRFHATSKDSPFFPEKEFEEARRTLPERIFRQEYLAEFLEDGSEVFRGIKDCIGGELEEPKAGHRYIIGVDLAKSVDFTVLTIWDSYRGRNQLVGFERFNQLDWIIQERRIVAAAQKWNNAILVLDASGVGDPVYDRLARSGVGVVPVKFTQAVKDGLVLGLSMAIEKGEIRFPEIAELIAELKTFSFERLPSGRLKYGAPDGLHDDIVISMALAVSHLTHGRVETKISAIGETIMGNVE